MLRKTDSMRFVRATLSLGGSPAGPCNRGLLTRCFRGYSAGGTRCFRLDRRAHDLAHGTYPIGTEPENFTHFFRSGDGVADDMDAHTPIIGTFSEAYASFCGPAPAIIMSRRPGGV